MQFISLHPKSRPFSHRQARPHNKQASAIPGSLYEPFPLFHPIRTDHDREELARCSSPERDRPTKDYLAVRRAHDSSKDRAHQKTHFGVDDSSDSATD